MQLKFADFLSHSTRFPLFCLTNTGWQGDKTTCKELLWERKSWCWSQLHSVPIEICEWDHEYNECNKGHHKSAYQISATFKQLFYLQALPLNSRGFCWYTVYHSRMRKALTEKVSVPFYLLGKASSAFTECLDTINRHSLKPWLIFPVTVKFVRRQYVKDARILLVHCVQLKKLVSQLQQTDSSFRKRQPSVE